MHILKSQQGGCFRICIYHFVHSAFPTMAAIEEMEGREAAVM